MVLEVPFAEFTEHMQCRYCAIPESHDFKTKLEIFPVISNSYKFIEMETEHVSERSPVDSSTLS